MVPLWYLLGLTTVPPFLITDNDRYPDVCAVGLHEYLVTAHCTAARLTLTRAPPAPPD